MYFSQTICIFFFYQTRTILTCLAHKAAFWRGLRRPSLEICSVDIVSVSLPLCPEKVTMKRICCEMFGLNTKVKPHQATPLQR